MKNNHTQLIIDNDGARIKSSNFWDIPRDGYVLSIHEHCFRLLMPDPIQASHYAREMGAATHVDVIRTPRSPCPYSGLLLELAFIDGSPNPCTIHLSKEELAPGYRLPGRALVGKKMEFKMYTGPSDNPCPILELPARLSIEPEIVPHRTLPRVVFREIKAS